MRSKEFLIGAIVLLCTPNLFAWGEEGHRVIGRAAYELLDGSAREEVYKLLGKPSDADLADAISGACNWPDAIRNEDQWKWSSPLHYVNIPRSSSEYDRQRDCPDGRCATEGILHFASQLTYDEMDTEKQWQAFAFVCHLVGDLHQPLHAGFRDDRGGNTVEIEYRGQEWNLHQFWDGVVVREKLQGEDEMVSQLVQNGRADACLDWNTTELKAWTEESHALAANKAYPEHRVIDQVFADRSWDITVEQWEMAAGRLAKILNAVLGENEVLVDEPPSLP